VKFLVLQAATAAILFTGGNTSFTGFPFLASFVAEDSFLPSGGQADLDCQDAGGVLSSPAVSSDTLSSVSPGPVAPSRPCVLISGTFITGPLVPAAGDHQR